MKEKLSSVLGWFFDFIFDILRILTRIWFKVLCFVIYYGKYSGLVYLVGFVIMWLLPRRSPYLVPVLIGTLCLAPFPTLALIRNAPGEDEQIVNSVLNLALIALAVSIAASVYLARGEQLFYTQSEVYRIESRENGKGFEAGENYGYDNGYDAGYLDGWNDCLLDNASPASEDNQSSIATEKGLTYQEFAQIFTPEERVALYNEYTYGIPSGIDVDGRIEAYEHSH